jgi:type II secretory pathway pseudopilin PulG
MSHKRTGYALMTVILTLAIVAVMLSTITLQVVMNRQAQVRREAQLQALWLARAGLELGAARLASDSDYRGDALELIPTGLVRIEIERDKDVIRVLSESTYTGTQAHPVVRALSRTYESKRR